MMFWHTALVGWLFLGVPHFLSVGQPGLAIGGLAIIAAFWLVCLGETME